MRAEELKPGTIFLFTPTGEPFKIARVTEKRISWYLGFTATSSWGKNQMRLTWTSLKHFQEGIDKGAYKIIK